MDGLHRANVGTSAAIGANLGVNLVDIAFRDSFHRALVDTGSASGAVIIDFISHDQIIWVPGHGTVSKAVFGTKIKKITKTNGPLPLLFANKQKVSRPFPFDIIP